MKCSELNPGDAVVFAAPPYNTGRENIFDGTVTSVAQESQLVHVCYLEGYKSRDDAIPFGKMIAKHDKGGEEMLFGGWIRGNSVLLEPT